MGNHKILAHLALSNTNSKFQVLKIQDRGLLLLAPGEFCPHRPGHHLQQV